MSPVRVRQHVNPLAIKYLTPILPLDWEQIYLNSTQPLHLDIGCAKGQFLLEMAKIEPSWNYLGLEIRSVLVDDAILTTRKLNLTNLHYLFCNVNNTLTPLLKSLFPGTLQRVTIQFPDPWFKNKHHKRRVVQPELVNDLATYLAIGGEVFIQSDIEEVEREMCDRFSSHPSFERQNDGEWLAENPLPVATEREIGRLKLGEPVYRALYHKSGTLY